LHTLLSTLARPPDPVAVSHQLPQLDEALEPIQAGQLVALHKQATQRRQAPQLQRREGRQVVARHVQHLQARQQRRRRQPSSSNSAAAARRHCRRCACKADAARLCRPKEVRVEAEGEQTRERSQGRQAAHVVAVQHERSEARQGATRGKRIAQVGEAHGRHVERLQAGQHAAAAAARLL
jgi:hypothetical protein